MVDTAKYREVYEALRCEILGGKYNSSCAVPSAMALAKRFGTTRATVRRSLEQLRNDGLVGCRRGSGTFVTKAARSRKIGLIVPGVAYSEFFPPVVGEISRLAQEKGYALLFADISSPNPDQRARQAEAFAAELVREQAAGVIYQPLELITKADEINQKIVSILSAAGIAVVLLDYDTVSPPGRSGFDIVGINNPDAGFRMAGHLLDCGAKKVDFQMSPDCAPSVRNRLRGVMTAMHARRLKCRVLTAKPEDAAALKRHLRGGRPDAFICCNDTSAARFKQTLEAVGLTVPGDMLLAGFDDVRIASLLTPPLTTIRQPCREIGAAAFARLLDRIADPELPAQEIFLSAPLVVRGSTLREKSNRTHARRKRK